MPIEKPALRPARPYFSSGPCAKHPAWSPTLLNAALLGRSHRSAAGKARIQSLLSRTRRLLALPDVYRLGLTPASDTGAFESVLWTMLGARGVDCWVWESFGQGWYRDLSAELKLQDLRLHRADYGALPDLSAADWERDQVLVWNGTTSGVRVPDGEWIRDDRRGLTICDATSAVLAMPVPWPKLDAVTFSWQKVLGGEAQHGMLVLSPRAAERVQHYDPPWPVPKVLRLKTGGRLNEDIFTGGATNTPSLLCIEDFLDALSWAEANGGAPGLLHRCERNYAALRAWVEVSPWVGFLAADAAHRSPSSVCLKLVEPWFTEQSEAMQRAFVRRLCDLLEAEGVAYDINAHRDAPPGLRVWCGATVEVEDVERLTPWLDWAYRRSRDTIG